MSLYLEKFIMKRAMCECDTRSYGKLFVELIKNKIDNTTELKKRLVIEEKEKWSTKNLYVMPSNEVFIEAFVTDYYEGNNFFLKVVLYFIEIYLRQENKKCNASGNRYIVNFNNKDKKECPSLEHINPN